MNKGDALRSIHFPKDQESLQKARLRLKFEELFYVQVQLLEHKQVRVEKHPGQLLQDTQLLHRFYHEYLPFSLTDAQQRVVKEIYHYYPLGHAVTDTS